MTDLPAEPPVGSIVAVPGVAPFVRFSNAAGDATATSDSAPGPTSGRPTS